MSIAFGVVALALISAGPEKPADAKRINYTVRTVELPAIAWRESNVFRLKSVDNPGGNPVWTGSQSIVKALADQKGAEVKVFPTVHTQASQSALIGSHETRFFVTGVKPEVGSGKVTWLPETKSILEGFSTFISADETPGGIRAQIGASSHWLADVRDVRGTPVVGGPTLTVQLPQVVSTNVNGEWIIPDGDVLVMSLGTYTAGKKDAVLVERLAIIEVQKVPATPAEPEVIPAGFDSVATPPIVPGVVPIVALERPSTPPMPSRSLLRPVGPDGKEVELPPLPDDQVATTSADDSSDPRPSPQSKTPVAGMRFDPLVAVTRYQPAAIGLDGAVLASGRPQTIRIPLSSRLAIELKATIVPAAPHE